MTGLPLEWVKGDTNQLLIAVKDPANPLPDGQPGPYNLEDAKLWLTAKRALSDLDAAAVVRLDSDPVNGLGGIVVADPPTAGQALATIPYAALDSLAAPGWVYWDVQVLTASGQVWTVARGTAAVVAGATLANA
jgi:hypothetical protein